MKGMKRVVVLGSTGSIGTQTLDIIRMFPDRLKVVGLAASQSRDLLQQQAAEFGVAKTVLFAEEGMQAMVDLATMEEADIVVTSVAGVIGLEPTFAAIQAGKAIALASKEVLVAAGEVVMPMCEKHGVLMTPIDSEHSAVFQCLQGYSNDQIDKVILTASGGPFRGKTRADLEQVSLEDTLNHPTWRMGGKITVDSATLMNKGLEMIEARWLFGVEMDQVDVVVHPQSIVHSMVRFTDGSVLGQLGWPNMRLPIVYALLYPERPRNELPIWNPADTPTLTFEKPDTETFPALDLARAAAKIGKTMPAALNAANEHIVNSFLKGRLPFLGIPKGVEYVMNKHVPIETTLESILETDRWARRVAEEWVREFGMP